MTDVPRSWNSLEDHPELRRPTPEEWEVIDMPSIPKAQLTQAIAADLVVCYTPKLLATKEKIEFEAA